MNKETFEFVVYMIHACAHKWGQSPSVVYMRMQQSGCIVNYLIPHYDVLHTQGTPYIVTDIEKYLESSEGAA